MDEKANEEGAANSAPLPEASPQDFDSTADKPGVCLQKRASQQAERILKGERGGSIPKLPLGQLPTSTEADSENAAGESTGNHGGAQSERGAKQGSHSCAEKSKTQDRIHKWAARLKSPRLAGTPDECAEPGKENVASSRSEPDEMASRRTQLEQFSTDTKLTGDAAQSARQSRNAGAVSSRLSRDPEALLKPVQSKVKNQQHTGELTYVLRDNESWQYLGWMRAGVEGMWEQTGALRWKKDRDLHEYHGDFHEGMPHGHGTHIFPDGSRVTGSFARGCPTGTALLRDQDELYHEVVYTENVSLLEQHVPISKMPTAQPAQLLYYCKYGGMCPMVALTIGVGIPIQNDSGKELLKGNYPNLPEGMCVAGTLVWARPAHAQVPLWNAHEVNGNIVAIMRGPAPPAPGVGYAVKLQHAQLAGAKAVVFVDYDTDAAKFTQMPAVLPLPDGSEVEARIPTCLILAQHANFLQESANHELIYYSDTPACQAGFVRIPVQERTRLHKHEAAALMAEFFDARRKEKGADDIECSSKNLWRRPADATEPAVNGAPVSPNSARSIFGINPHVFEAVIPFINKNESAAARRAHAEQLGLGGVHKTLRSLAVGLSSKIPWIRKKKEQQEVRVWRVRGAAPFAVNWVHEDGDISFHLALNPVEKEMAMNSVKIQDGIFGKWGENEAVAYEASKDGQDEVTVTVDNAGFHVLVDGVHKHLFAHRMPWPSNTFEHVEVDLEWGNYAEVLEMPSDAHAANLIHESKESTSAAPSPSARAHTFETALPTVAPPPAAAAPSATAASGDTNAPSKTARWLARRASAQSMPTISTPEPSASAHAPETAATPSTAKAPLPATVVSPGAAAPSKAARWAERAKASAQSALTNSTSASETATPPSTTKAPPPATVVSQGAAAPSKAARWAERAKASAQSALTNSTSASETATPPSTTTAPSRSWAFRIQYQMIFVMQMDYMHGQSPEGVFAMLKTPVAGWSKMARWSKRALASACPPKDEGVSEIECADGSWSWGNFTLVKAKPQAIPQQTKPSVQETVIEQQRRMSLLADNLWSPNKMTATQLQVSQDSGPRKPAANIVPGP